MSTIGIMSLPRAAIALESAFLVMVQTGIDYSKGVLEPEAQAYTDFTKSNKFILHATSSMNSILDQLAESVFNREAVYIGSG